MGLLKKLLLGPILGADKSPRMPGYLREASQTPSQRRRWVCIFCGRHTYHCGKPPANFGGSCKNSPYGNHFYEEG